MSSITLKALQESQLKSAVNSQGVEPFGVYSMEKFGNSFDLAKDTVRATPKNTVSGSVFGKSVRFPIDRYATLASMAIKTTMSVVSSNSMGTDANDLFGAKLFSQIEFKCLGRTIQTQYPMSCIQQINDSDVEVMGKYRAATDAVFSVASGTTTTVVEVYTPLFYFFDQDPDYFLDFSFLEQCEIHATFASKLDLFKPDSSSNLTSVTYTDSELVQNFIVLPQEIQQEVNQKNLNSATPYSAVGFDTHQEAVATHAITTTEIAAASYSFVLPASTNKHLTIDSVFRCRNTVTNVDLAVTRVQVSASGKTLIDVYKKESQLSEGRLGIHLGATDKSMSLHYGMSKEKYMPGVFPAADLNNVIYTVTVDVSSGASNTNPLELHYAHSYSKLITINGGTGVIESSISS